MDNDKPATRKPGRSRPAVTAAHVTILPATISGRVFDAGGAHVPIRKARVFLLPATAATRTYEGPPPIETDDNGEFTLATESGRHLLVVEAFGKRIEQEVPDLGSACRADVEVGVPVGLEIVTSVTSGDCEPRPCADITVGTILTVEAVHDLTDEDLQAKPITFDWRVNRGAIVETTDRAQPIVHVDTGGAPGPLEITVTMREVGSASMETSTKTNVANRPVQPISGAISVGLRRTASTVTSDLPLWLIIRTSTDAMSFRNYQRFMDVVLCGVDPNTEGLFDDFERRKIIGEGGKLASFADLQKRRYLPFTDSDAYRLLKVATEAFLTVNCGTSLANVEFDAFDVRDLVSRTGIENIDSAAVQQLWNQFLQSVNGTSYRTLPYLSYIAAKFPELRLKNAIFTNIPGGTVGAQADSCYGLLASKLTQPCLLELIWSYWHEEGMLVQTMNAISMRFQNRRGPEKFDPLANTEIDPLRPLNNLLWGYIQDEQHRLTVVRRAYEYDHHYGLRLQGRAIPELRTADSRSQFLQAFHHLLHRCALFYQQDDDTTVISDGFPVLNALKEVHLILSQGAHNQFGDLPFTARVEMLIQQWLLARPEFREFLPTRVMVAYPEPWMDRVDAMKKLQNWSDVNILHFRDLGMFGERLLLSVRFGDWVDVNEPDQAKNWARFWRAEIQGYIHAYRAVTGVDVSIEPVNATLPSVLLRERVAQQQRLRA